MNYFHEGRYDIKADRFDGHVATLIPHPSWDGQWLKVSAPDLDALKHKLASLRSDPKWTKTNSKTL